MAAADSEPTIAVIVPVHDGGASLRRCLDGVRACRPAPDELIVVDDGSRDDSAAIAAAAGARVIALGRRHGPAHARNRGAEAASGQVLFFVDADVVVYADAVGQVREAFAREPHLSAVFGSYDDRPAAPNFLSQYKNLMHHYVHQRGREEASTFWAGCGAVRRQVFLAAGGFDERYWRPSIEDIELGYRLRRGGHAIRLRKSLQATHLKRWSARSLLASDIRDRALPWAELLRRGGALIDDLNLRWSSRASVLVAGALAAALLAAPREPRTLALAAPLAAALLALNAGLYAFFARSRGLAFALACVPWHWLYLLYGGGAVAVTAARAVLGAPGALVRPTR